MLRNAYSSIEGHRHLLALRCMAVVLALAIAACFGQIGEKTGATAGESPSSGGKGDEPAPSDDAPGHTNAPEAPPGVLPAHRLTNAQYNNTVRDLLGSASRPADFFKAASSTGFDNEARALSGMTPELLLGYLEAARSLSEELFASGRAGDVLPCVPSDAADLDCVRRMLAGFGRRAWRRPLDATELDGLLDDFKKATNQLALDARTAARLVIQSILASPHFYYRLELDGPSDKRRRAGGYELASRLSYALWSSMPDDELLALAAADQLFDVTILERQVERMLKHEKAAGFMAAFMKRWLHLDNLAGHVVDGDLFPQWSQSMQRGMDQQAERFLESFVNGTRPMGELLSSPVPGHEALEALLAADPPRIRAGLLTLPAFLTLTSKSNRTSPTLRAEAVLEGLLCTPLPAPPNIAIPDLADAADQGADPENVREMMELHRRSPACRACHEAMDPVGLALENFDPIGRYRTQYAGGARVDASGVFAGKPFDGVTALAAILSEGEQLRSCATENLFAYLTGRHPEGSDSVHLEAFSRAWTSGRLSDLAKIMVKSPVFRERGQANQQGRQ